MTKVGFIGWRGMVGSVLVERMLAENDFASLEPVFFSTSNVGGQPPDIAGLAHAVPPLQDASDVNVLSALDILMSCQGGDYTSDIHPKLRAAGWKGYWIDAASTLRMADDAIIVLDPINRALIDKALKDGVKNYIGGNCTVSLMLLATAGLFKANLVEWVAPMTYQAASGAGARNMIELIKQMRHLGNCAHAVLDNPSATALDLDRTITSELRNGQLPTEAFGVPLAASLIPWIDRPMDNGQTKEEWKGFAESNKILGTGDHPIPIDGECIRVGVMRCHSQGLTIKLTRDVSLSEIENLIATAHPWVKLIPNNREDSIRFLTPAAVSGTLDIVIGRMRKMNLGLQYLTAFTVGDQLLWGAAEPLRRMLRIVLEHKGVLQKADA